MQAGEEIAMSYKLNIHEFNTVTDFTGPQRYAYFLVKSAEWQEVWTLSSLEGFVTLGDGVGNVCVPVWPHRDFAAALVAGQWSDCKVTSINIVEFMQKWAQGMARAGYCFAVFPTIKQTGVVVKPDRLRSDLLEEIKKQKVRIYDEDSK
jgi:hypothetical protein